METKQQKIFKVLDRRLREAAHRKGVTPVVATRATIDRLEYAATSFRAEQNREIRGFVSARSHFIRQKPDAWSAYSHLQLFRSLDGKTTVAILSQLRIHHIR